MFFQTAISYSQNLQSQTNFIFIDCKMFVDYENNNRILLNMKYRRKRGMSWSSSVLFFRVPIDVPGDVLIAVPVPVPIEL